MKQSKKLTEFYRHYSDAVYAHKKGKKVPGWFDYTYGICGNLEAYEVEYDVDLSSELKNQFKAANLDTEYPFGYNAFCNYIDMTKDKNRIRWIKRHLTRNVKKKFKLKD